MSEPTKKEIVVQVRVSLDGHIKDPLDIVEQKILGAFQSMLSVFKYSPDSQTNGIAKEDTETSQWTDLSPEKFCPYPIWIQTMRGYNIKGKNINLLRFPIGQILHDELCNYKFKQYRITLNTNDPSGVIINTKGRGNIGMTFNTTYLHIGSSDYDHTDLDTYVIICSIDPNVAAKNISEFFGTWTLDKSEKLWGQPEIRFIRRE